MDLYEQWQQLESKEQWKLYNSIGVKMFSTGAIIRIIVTTYTGELAAVWYQQLAAIFTILAAIIIHSLDYYQTRGRNCVVFLIFQIYQLINLLYAMNRPEQFGPIMLFSAVMCITVEVSWFYNRWVTLLIVNKHFFIWLFAWKVYLGVDTSWWSLFAFPTSGYILYMNIMLWGNHSFFTAMSYERFVAQKSAEHRGEFIEGILRSVRTGLVVLDDKLEVQLANAALLDLFAIKHNSDLQTRLKALQYTDNPKTKTLLEDAEMLYKDSSEVTADLGLTQIEGKSLEWKATKVNLSSQDLLILVCSDVTDLIAIQKIAKDESAAKTVLLRTVTHELRTPLNAVINLATDLIEREDGSAEVKNQLSILRTSGQLMLFVTNDLLDFSQLMAGKLRLHYESFEVRKLVAEITSLLRFQAEKKDLHLVVSVCGRTPQTVYSDPNRFAQVLLNLCSNALK
jgi:nitrogen-specific signal transduction histidine kinase